jgi:asparagine synthase (glutamine-hydrolysing)
MSGIMGIWHARGEPVPQELLLRMNERMAHRGRDGAAYLMSGSAGFAYQQLKVTPDARREKQPHQATNGAIVLWDGRLDNRSELITRLRSQASLTPDSSDVEIVSAAYEGYRSGFISVLEGDFAVAVFDPHEQNLMLGRDAMGARPLFFCRRGDVVLFASEIKVLLAHPVVKPLLDEPSLAEFLFGAWDHADETNTLFSGISRVPPAVLVSISPDKTSSARYFDFDVGAELRLKDQSEYVEAFRECFARAVGRRLRSAYPTAVLLSGGLDSSSILCMGQFLQKENQISPTLIPIGLVAEDDPGAQAKANEWDFQKAVQDHCSLEMIRIPITSFEFGADRKRKVWHAEAPWVIQNQELLLRLTEEGARVVLSGMFGDNLLLSPQFLLDLVVQGKWLAALRSYQGLMTLPWLLWDEHGPDKVQLRSLLGRELRRYLIPEVLRPLYRAIRRRPPEARRSKFYSPRFLQVAEDVERRSQPLSCPPGRAHAKAIYLAARSKNLNLRIEMDANAMARFPIDVAYPFRDRELVQMIMSMPGEAVYPGGDSRGIQREALRGILPESVRLRRDKGNFTRFARLSVLKDAEQLKLLKDGHAMRLGLLAPPDVFEADVTRLVRDLSRSDDSSMVGHSSAGKLLALEDFLQSFF